MMLDDVKALLGITTDEQDAVLRIMIADAESAVRDYCRLKECPEELSYVVRELVAASFILNNEGNVASVKRGDTTISYNTAITGASFTDRQRDVLARYRNRFRLH